MSEREIRQQLEAILFIADQPVPLTQLAEVTETARDRIEEILRAMATEWEDAARGMVLREVAGGWRFYTNPDVKSYVEKFVLSVTNPRLTQAALETLAIVAYKQPISRQQIAAIRGVDSDGVVTTLLTRGLVREVGRDPGPGQAVLYGTTDLFLERMGLNDLADLPEIASMLPAPAAADELEP